MHRPRRTALALTTAIAAAAAAAVVAAVAPAGVPLVDRNGEVYRWDLDAAGQPNVDAATGEVTYFADAASLDDQVNGPKTAADAIRDAVQAWAVGTTRIRFRSDPSRPANGRNGSDRVNWIGWSSTELSPFTFAATFPTRNGSTVTDMDVVLNDRSFSWDTWSTGVLGDADIQALIAHEWGHAVGCDHVPLRASTMYFSASTGQLSLRSLEADDRALVGSIYPNAAFGQTTGTITGKVAIAGVKDDRAAHVIAVAVGTAEPAASALTAPDGSFAVRGLPRGTYRLVVAPTNPLGSVMNEWWRSGTTAFLPAVASTAAGNPAPATTLRVDVDAGAGAGGAAATDAGVITVSNATGLFEPNDSAAAATPIHVGDAVCARFETTSDQDWYSFTANAGERLTLSVLCWEIGSDADPSLRVTDDAGAIVQTVVDIRGGASVFGLAGEDRDARFVGWRVPSTGTWRVRIGQDKPVDGPQSFYVLFVTVASDSPSPSLTGVTAAPDRIDAGGAATTTLVVTPRREDGFPVGAGATVQVAHSGDGSVGATLDAGDGTYRVPVTSAPGPGRDSFSVVVTTAQGVATSQDAATLVYVGPADGARTSLVADPRRIAVDDPADDAPAETATVRYVPRDAAGEALGSGRQTSVALAPDAHATLATPIDRGDGVYEATLTAGTTPGAATVSASVGGQGAVATAPCAIGFGLPDVLQSAAADVEAFRSVPGLPKRAAAPLAQAAKRIAAATAAAAVTPAAPRTERRALSSTTAALASVHAAVARAAGHVTDPGTQRELALAVRTAARAAVSRAVIRTGRDQDRVVRAESLLASGDGLAATAAWPAAAARWLRAYRTVFAQL